MDKKINRLWDTVLGEIETEVSKANFLTLFKNTALLSLEEKVATVGVPSAMIINLLKKRFYPLVKKSLDKHTKKDVSIIFVPKVSLKTKQTVPNGPLFVGSEKPQVNQKTNTFHNLPRVRHDFTFENLAVSGSNQLAYVSAQTVAKNLGKSYNPLFIYGPVGVGKTHLMQAIANEAYAQNPKLTIIYITSEEFTNEVVEAIRSNNTALMKKRFRSTSLLLIDDVQFIAGKDRVQEELFHTFNILIDSSSQIILSSDRPPTEIKKLEKRLSSRFSGGLTVDIEPPDFELRTAILLIKARKYNVSLPMDVAKIIAQEIEDTRNLEGALLRTITESTTKKEEIDTALALKVLRSNKNNGGNSHLHPDDIVKHVCLFYSIKHTLMKGPKRDAFLVKARQVLMYLLKKELDLTYVEIGNLLGGRDHTTIMHGVEKIEKMIEVKPKLAEEIKRITQFYSG